MTFSRPLRILRRGLRLAWRAFWSLALPAVIVRLLLRLIGVT